MNSNWSYRITCILCIKVYFLLFTISLFAQNDVTDRSTNQGNYILENELGNNFQGTSTAAINQGGVENQATINQTRAIDQLSLNAHISQDGAYNEAIIVQTGGEQNFYAIQSGFENFISSEMNGNKFQVYLEQDGQNNTIYQELSGSETEGVFIITQQGADHELYHTREGNAPVLQISQTGYGAKATIEQQ